MILEENNIEYLSRDGVERLPNADQEPAKASLAAFKYSSFVCDECDRYITPSNGGRYQCTIRENYDLCAECVGKNVHENHAFVRLLNWKTEIPSVDGTGATRIVQLQDTYR
ncbi:hypothetical protein PENTCL1PPCAC_8532, partial [Pristionchus entomophagus]